MRALAIVFCGLLGGCQTSPPPRPVPIQPPAPQGTWCERAAAAIGNSYLDPALKAVLFERMRNQGCMGQPQPQTVIIR